MATATTRQTATTRPQTWHEARAAYLLAANSTPDELAWQEGKIARMRAALPVTGEARRYAIGAEMDAMPCGAADIAAAEAGLAECRAYAATAQAAVLSRAFLAVAA